MKINNNEIKKALYKEKPIAIKVGKNKEQVQYNTFVNGQIVKFLIPIEEAVFEDKIQAQLLIRWMQ